jgi:hypothetical protein
MNHPGGQAPRCERDRSGKKCGRRTVAFVMGQNVCAEHDPTGSEWCSHSLAPSGRCAHCGSPTDPEPRTERSEAQ